MDKKTYTPTEWVKSLVKLTDIAVLGGIELAETAVNGPATYQKYVSSGNFTVKTVDTEHERRLTLVSLSRPGAADVVLAFYRPHAEVVEIRLAEENPSAGAGGIRTLLGWSGRASGRASGTRR